MSTLIMVRHGQASFGASHYDKLSDKGIAQAMALGEHWVRNGLKLDAAFSGSQERQRRTLEIVRDICLSEGLEFPEPQVRDAFDEYDADGIMRHFLPRLVEHEPRLGELVGRISDQGYASDEGRKAFQEAFGIVMKHWLQADGVGDGVESWGHFRGRVLAGVERLRAEYGSSRTVAVFTSGGPVSAVMQAALQSPDRVALELAWVIKNGSITEFRYAGERFTLSGFNMTPHYLDESLVTFR
jgi:broad specificity phosphatase PhoE